MKRSILAIGIALILSACETVAGYETLLQSWVGDKESSLISSWGPPDAVYESDGIKYLTYQRQATGYIPGTAPTYTTNFIGNTAYTTSYGGTSGYAYTKHCKTTFTVEKKVITNWRWEGNSCKARPPQ